VPYGYDLPVADNLLDRQFTVQKPNQVYVGDITYIHTREGWLYLAVVIDLYSRYVVGWSMDGDIPTGHKCGLSWLTMRS
jgi:transposase InsO family protein